jgi:uncharacterized membrane protein YheB (UPF0754 family)
VSEERALELVESVPGLVTELIEVMKHQSATDKNSLSQETVSTLFERSLFLAAHYNRQSLVERLFDSLLNYLQTRTSTDLLTDINRVARQCLRTFRKLGLGRNIDRFLKQASELILQGRPVDHLKLHSKTQWPDLIVGLLAVSEGWLYFGKYSEAMVYLNAARDTIFGNQDKAYKAAAIAKITRAYLTAIGQLPPEEAMNRMEELFRKMEKIPNAFTTAKSFSKYHIGIIEDMIRALISETFSLSAHARRWIDEEELIVRHRIHADMAKAMAKDV